MIQTKHHTVFVRSLSHLIAREILLFYKEMHTTLE